MSVCALGAPRRSRAEDAVPPSQHDGAGPRGGGGVGSDADTQPDPSGYRALIDAAVLDYDAGRFEEARSLFLKAHALFPNARTHRGIGKAEFELRNYPASIAQLEAALKSPARPLDAGLRSDAQELLARARAFVGTVAIVVQPAPSELLVDGAPTNLSPGEPLVLRVGNHVVEAHVPGHAPQRRSITVNGGDNLTVTMSFGAPMAAQASEERRGWYKSPWLWSAVGGVVVGGVTAGVLASRSGGPDRAQTDAYVMTR